MLIRFLVEPSFRTANKVGLALFFFFYLLGHIFISTITFLTLKYVSPDTGFSGSAQKLVSAFLSVLFLHYLLRTFFKISIFHLISKRTIRWASMLFASCLFLMISTSLAIMFKFSNITSLIKFISIDTPLQFSLLALFFTAFHEEVVFRGLLSKAIFNWKASLIPSILIPSIMFSVIHLPDTELNSYEIFYVTFYFLLIGLLLQYLSLVTNGLESAIGIHWAHNAAAVYLLMAQSTNNEKGFNLILLLVDILSVLITIVTIQYTYTYVCKLKLKSPL